MAEDYVIDLERKAPDAPVASGTHLAKIAAVEKKQGPAAEYLNWRLEVIGTGDPDISRSVWHMTSLAPQAKFKLDQFLDALGAPMSGRVSASKLIGYKLKIVVEHEDYQGTPRARVKAVLSAGAAAGKEAVTAPAKTTFEPAAPKQTKLQATFDDDIPF